MKLLSRYQEQAYAFFRVMAGLMFMGHGVQKLLGFPVKFPFPMNPMTMAAGGIELIGGALIVIGLFTRPVAFLASGMCAVGYWIAHGSKGFFPITNGGELIALYCFVFLFIATYGAGIWSVDNLRRKKA